MEWIEVSARSLDDARELALDRLGVVAEELEFEVLDEPRGGLFGLGRTDARIRARVKPLVARSRPTAAGARTSEAGAAATANLGASPRLVVQVKDRVRAKDAGGSPSDDRPRRGSAPGRSRSRRGGRGGGGRGPGQRSTEETVPEPGP